jgi:dehydrogenase/reductase SDR family protein 4
VCHVGNADQRTALIKFAVDTYGGLDVLVNNAAVSVHFGQLMETPGEALDKMFDINVKAAFLLT